MSSSSSESVMSRLGFHSPKRFIKEESYETKRAIAVEMGALIGLVIGLSFVSNDTNPSKVHPAPPAVIARSETSAHKAHEAEAVGVGIASFVLASTGLMLVINGYEEKYAAEDRRKYEMQLPANQTPEIQQ